MNLCTRNFRKFHFVEWKYRRAITSKVAEHNFRGRALAYAIQRARMDYRKQTNKLNVIYHDFRHNIVKVALDPRGDNCVEWIRRLL